MVLFYFFAAISLYLGLLSLRSGIRFARYVRQQLNREVPDYTPFVTIIAPCRGVDQGFRENLAAVLGQDYPHYEVLFVTGSETDDAVSEIQKLQTEKQDGVELRLIISGEALDCGQKVHNLRFATSRLSGKTEVIAFVDSDARPASNWLRNLVAPLADENVGAATGYRWFVPLTGGFASKLRSVWNASIASALGDDTSRNFCWGGSTAIRRSHFEHLKISEHWKGSVSDDFTVTRVLQQAGKPIHFVPACLVPSFEDCSIRELLTFSNRQLQITRVYAPHLWKPLLIGSVIFNLTFFGGIALVIREAFAGGVPYLAVLALVLVFILGALKSLIRFRAVKSSLIRQHYQLSGGFLAHLLLWPAASLLQLINCVVAGLSRRIVWRGITYELKSPNETVIIARD